MCSFLIASILDAVDRNGIIFKDTNHTYARWLCHGLAISHELAFPTIMSNFSVFAFEWIEVDFGVFSSTAFLWRGHGPAHGPNHAIFGETRREPPYTKYYSFLRVTPSSFAIAPIYHLHSARQLFSLQRIIVARRISLFSRPR